MRSELIQYCDVPKEKREAFKTEVMALLTKLSKPVTNMSILGALVLVVYKCAQRENKRQEPNPIAELEISHALSELFINMYGIEAFANKFDLLDEINKSAQKHGINLGTNAVLHGLMLEMTDESASQN